MERNRQGLTLAELLITVAIIAVLVGVAIPVFTEKLEQSRESVDFADTRNVYAEVMIAANTDDGNATIDGVPVKQADGTYMGMFSPLKQRIDGWSTRVEGMEIGGVPSAEWIGEPMEGGACTVTYTPATGETTIIWGTGFEGKSLNQLHSISNDKRVRADQRSLMALGKAILDKHWTQNDLIAALGLPETNGGGVRIADYYQLKDGEYNSLGFKITSTNNDNLIELLKSIGYQPGSVISTEVGEGGRLNTTYTNSLFYSDQLATNHYGNNSIDQTKRSIIIEKIQTNTDDTIKSMTIYTKAMDNQSNMGEADKAKFRITIP